MSNFPIYYFSVSKLSHAEYCMKRSKLEIFNQVGEPKFGTGSIARGNKLHFIYSYPNKGFDRLRLRLMLRNLAILHKSRYVFKKQVDNIIVLGMYDDLRVIRIVKTGKKYTALIEVKTTSKKYMWSKEVKAAVKQLQLYMWLLKEILEKLGYPLWERSYVEIYSQKDGSLLRIIPVKYDYDIENWVRHVVNCFNGLEPVSIPSFKFCKLCPVNVKTSCDWYKARKEYYGKQKETF